MDRQLSDGTFSSADALEQKVAAPALGAYSHVLWRSLRFLRRGPETCGGVVSNSVAVNGFQEFFQSGIHLVNMRLYGCFFGAFFAAKVGRMAGAHGH